MKYFDEEYLNFLTELGFNNSKDWFDENRKRYKNYVRKPFKNFIDNLIFQVQEIDPEILIEPKNAVFRINRDIRFSKDKTPYKTHMGAVLGRSKRKEVDFASFYLQLSPQQSFMGGGAYFLDTENLRNLRRYISSSVEEFVGITSTKKFLKLYPEIIGERNKRIPPEFKKVLATLPTIANKRFYVSAPLTPQDILSENLMDKVIEGYKTVLPFLQYLRKGLNPAL